MPSIRVNLRLTAHKDAALKNAPDILERHLKGGMVAAAKRLQRAARSRMRRDTGESHKSLVYSVQIRNGLNMSMSVYSTLIQALIDARGLRRGIFPDFRANSKLYGWAMRRIQGMERAKVKVGKVPVATPSQRRNRVKTARARQVRRVKRITNIESSGKPLGARARYRTKNTDVRRLTFLIARSIYRRGIKATNWPYETLRANKTAVIRDLSNAFSRAVNEIRRAS